MLWTCGLDLMNNWIKLRGWLHSFSLSRVSHKGEFYLDRFLMRQPLHNSFYFIFCSSCVLFFLLLSSNLNLIIELCCCL